MATVTGLTAARMLEIEANSVVDGDVVSGNLILTKHDATTINAGSVIGPTGAGFNASVIAQTTNLNTIIAPGAYVQMVDAWATLALNYPRASMGGWLKVMAQGANVSQSYDAPYSATDPGLYFRTSANNGTTWGTWRKIILSDSTGAYTFKENVTFDKTIILTNTNTAIGQIQVPGGGVLRGSTGASVMMQYGGDTTHFAMINDDGTPYFRVPAAYSRTTAGTANMLVTSSGHITRATSLLAYKLNIEDAPEDWATKVLDLRPRLWIDRPNTERYADALTAQEETGIPIVWDELYVHQIDQRFPGFIAEEVIEAGLDIFVTKDVDGNPDGLAYDRIVAALLLTVKTQQTQIDELKAQVATLME